MNESTISAIEASLSATSSANFSFLDKLRIVVSKMPKISLPSINIPLFLGLVFFGGLLFLLWVTIVYYVLNDMEQRPLDPNIKRLIMILVVGFNFIGLLLYILVRPPTFDEIEQIEKEKELLELELKKLRKEMKSK